MLIAIITATDTIMLDMGYKINHNNINRSTGNYYTNFSYISRLHDVLVYSLYIQIDIHWSSVKDDKLN